MTIGGQKVWDEPGDRQEVWSTVLFADMVGYSRMMAQDERRVIDFMVGCSRMVNDVGRRYGGVLVQTTGDGFLLLFDTTKGALLFGQEFHRLVAKRQANALLQAKFRVGIHAGPVSRTGGLIYGNAVNVAARLEAKAQPGTCVIGQDIYSELASFLEKAGMAFTYIGEPALKNIPESIPLFQTRSEDAEVAEIAAEAPTISTLGGLAIQNLDTEIIFDGKLKSSALLGYLALANSQWEKNEKIASVLWPNRSAQAARRAFNNCKRKLTGYLNDERCNFLHSERGYTGLNEIEFNTDIGLYMAEIRNGHVPAYLVDTARWPNLILEGFERTSSVYKAWLNVTRTFWRTQILGELGVLLTRNAPEHNSTMASAKAVLNLEPGNEIASALLIRHHTMIGSRAAALEEYERLKRYLAETHGLQPSERVEDARAGVARQKAKRTAPDKPASPKSRRLIHLTVARFTSSDGLPPGRADGFRNELVSNLARFREWSVVDDTSRSNKVETVRSTQSDLAYTIDGSVDAMGQLRLSLRSLSTGRLIWSGDVALNTENWVAMQRDAVGRIAAHLDTYISADRLAQVIGIDERNATSHDRWLEAEMIFARWTPEAAREATNLLNSVISDDPGFAAAHSSLASYANVRHIIQPGLERDAAMAESAHELAQRSVELDQLDARNHLAVAWTAALTGSFDRAALHLDMAAALNPNGQSTLISCAMAYAFIGQPDRAEVLIDHVERIAPMLSEYQWCYIASVRFLAGRYEDALAAARKSGDRIVDNQGWIAASLVRLGRMDEAKEALDKLIDAVRPVWSGTESPTAEAVFDWFTNAYPMRTPSDRAHLADSLGDALRGQ